MSSACQYQKFILEDVFMKFGEKLKLLRQQAKWTQEQAARQIGVSTRTYQNYELCKMYPKQSSLYAKIADLYNVTVDYLLTNEEQLIADAAIRGGAKANGRSKRSFLSLAAFLPAENSPKMTKIK